MQLAGLFPEPSRTVARRSAGEVSQLPVRKALIAREGEGLVVLFTLRALRSGAATRGHCRSYEVLGRAAGMAAVLAIKALASEQIHGFEAVNDAMGMGMGPCESRNSKISRSTRSSTADARHAT